MTKADNILRNLQESGYRPLQSCLTIKESDIDGLGLFAKEDIPAGTNLGISHVFMSHELIRTPLGGFYNHSDTPNTKKSENKDRLWSRYELITILPIKAGEEITVKYTLYSIS